MESNPALTADQINLNAVEFGSSLDNISDPHSEMYFTLIYKRYYRSLFKLINRMIPDPDDAEDATQASFIKISRELPKYDPSKGKLYTWLARVASNTAMDMLRSNAFRLKSKSESLNEIILIDKTVTYNHINVETLGLTNLLTILTAREKTVIDLLYFQDFTQSEAAKKLGVPLSTIKTLARRALAKLRKICLDEIDRHHL